jgi:ElaB/YqjD/DUF883 family membrane-anchored ribosome-binding protein
MSDLSKKSQDINSLIGDIDDKESEIDYETGILERKQEEISNLEDDSQSIFEKLGSIGGEAVDAAMTEIQEKLEEKNREVEESREKIEVIKSELIAKQGEIERGIEEYSTAIEEIGVAEKECDVDLSQSRDTASSERDELIEANHKIEGILGKIESALSGDGDSAKKKPNDAFAKGVSIAISAVQIASGLLGGVVEGGNPDFTRIGLQGASDIVNEMGTRASSANEDEIKRRRREAENVSRADNQPRISR